MIAKIKYKNFKAFEDQEIEFRPLTIILGPNNSGKSSILSGLRILTQTIDSFDNNLQILLNGIMGDFGTFRDIVYNNNTKRILGISITLNEASLIEARQNKLNDLELSLRYKYRSALREIILHESIGKVKENILLSTKASEDGLRQIPQKINNVLVPIPLRGLISKEIVMRNFIPSLYPTSHIAQTSPKYSSFYKDTIKSKEFLISRFPRLFQSFFRSIDYIGAMRIPPSRTYLYSGERRGNIGPAGENSASILAMDSLRKGSQSRNIKEKVITRLAKAGIASDIKINQISDRHFEIMVKHPITSEYQNFADVGYGNSQIIPVLVGGYNLPSNSIYLIEEPEIHLHPKAQYELGDFFLDLFCNHIQTIVETHSEHLVIRLQQLVASKKISNNDIIFHYVYAETGKKCIKRLSLDDKGRFIEDWPEGFFPERLEQARILSQLRHI